MQQQSNSKPTQKWWQNEKKWATGQSCIRKEVTSYKIHTLGLSWKLQRTAVNSVIGAENEKSNTVYDDILC